ncbi:Zinc finger protein 568 [Frankliniella fusca]|uniref:Zinc finger protein 568 n=1 Tax=Frankliniella fusca TaxID=407009 RepID=A0AAE1LIV5_9NEOP|nr:Zinc finger protein 568 [Frankliniella fusca]
MQMLDFSKTCRLCMTQDYDLIPISTQSPDSSSIALASKITSTVALEVCEGDDLPAQICGGCYQRIDQWYNFKQVCHNSFSVLRQCVKQTDKKDMNQMDETLCEHLAAAVAEDPEKAGFLLGPPGPTDDMSSHLSCQVCGKVFSRYNSRVFQEKKTKATTTKTKARDRADFVCKVCAREFTRLDNLKTHELRMHSNGRSFFCDCGSGFVRKQDMIWHQNQHVKSSSPGLAPDPEELDKTLGCPICALPFPKIEKLNEHIELAHMDSKFQCNICLSKFYNKEELSWHQKHTMVPSAAASSSSWSHFICNICNHNFSNINMCKSHIVRVHGTPSVLKSNSCCQNFIFSNKQDMGEEGGKKEVITKAHRSRSGDPYFCSCCGKEFDKHGRSSGSGEKRSSSGSKNHECKECGKTFLTSSRLKTHTLIHTDVKPFVCEVCQGKFRTLSNLLAHKKRHTSDPKYVCKTCGKEFLSYSGLARHEILHTGVKDFACDECGKTFVTLQERRKHMKYHTGEKSHICKYCDKAFFESGHLAIHLRSHLNEKPYSCLVCSRSFDSTTKLKRHKKTDAHMRRMNVNQPPRETSRSEWTTNNYVYNETLVTNGGPSIYHI